MCRSRTVRFGISVLLLAAVVVGVGFSRPVRIAYHKWGLQSAKAKAVRLKREGPNKMDEFQSLFRKTPRNSVEFAATARRHAEALVELGFLHREEYQFAEQEFAAQDDLMRKLEDMNHSCPWWTYSVPPGATSLVVIACARGMSQWQEITEDLSLACTADCCPPGSQFAGTIVRIEKF